MWKFKKIQYTFNFLAWCLLFSWWFLALKKCWCILGFFGGRGGLRNCMVCTLMKMLTFMDGPLYGHHMRCTFQDTGPPQKRDCARCFGLDDFWLTLSTPSPVQHLTWFGYPLQNLVKYGGHPNVSIRKVHTMHYLKWSFIFYLWGYLTIFNT